MGPPARGAWRAPTVVGQSGALKETQASGAPCTAPLPSQGPKHPRTQEEGAGLDPMGDTERYLPWCLPHIMLVCQISGGSLGGNHETGWEEKQLIAVVLFVREG